MVGLEAMRHSKPVVAFNVGGIPDWLLHERTGLLVPPDDIQAFANALQRLLTDRETACRYGVEAARSIRRSFNFETYIDRLQAALMPTLSPAPSSLEMEYA
jgi:glycosyltransferase involved in cell wall biosynthesis